MKKKIFFFVLSVVKTKMSDKSKLNTKTLKEKCDILSHIEKSMTNKVAANKFSVPKNTIWNTALHSSNGGQMSLAVNKLQKFFTEDRIAFKKQTNICDLFKPVWL